MAADYPALARELAADHLDPLGVLQVNGFAGGSWVVPVANCQNGFWSAFTAADNAESEPMDSWVRSCLSRIAERHGCDLLMPMDGPPFHPFQSWALALGNCWQSPIGLLIHRHAGLWWALRGALVFESPLQAAPPIREAGPSPCLSCPTQPCLHRCPVAAFDGTGFAVDRCRQHLQTDRQETCIDAGCLARAACPYATSTSYPLAQRRFHMRYFRDSAAIDNPDRR